MFIGVNISYKLDYFHYERNFSIYRIFVPFRFYLFFFLEYIGEGVSINNFTLSQKLKCTSHQRPLAQKVIKLEYSS